MDLDFKVNELHRSGYELFTVPGPDLMRERLVPLNTAGLVQMAARMGVKPGRASASRWRVGGYPIDRNGPRVLLPYIVQVKKVYTTTQALVRFYRLVQKLSTEVQDAGGVKAWRAARMGKVVPRLRRRKKKPAEPPSTSASIG